MNFLVDGLLKDPVYDELIEGLKRKDSPIYLHGLIRESAPLFAYGLGEQLKKTVLILSDNELRAKAIADGIRGVAPDIVEFFPAAEVTFHNISAIEDNRALDRLRVMMRLIKGERLIISTTAQALQKRLTTPKTFQSRQIDITLEDDIDMDKLSEGLVALSYEKVSMVENRGQFAVRGGIVDIFPSTEEHPYRMELFDTEVDSIRRFDIQTQRSIETVDGFSVYPAVEMTLSHKERMEVVHRMRGELERLDDRRPYGVDVDRALEKFGDLIGYLESGLAVSNRDLVSPYLTKRGYASLLDYLPGDVVLYLEDLTRIYDAQSLYATSFEEDVALQIERGEALRTHEEILLPFVELLNRLKAFNLVNVTQLMKRTRLLNPAKILQIKSVEALNFNRNMPNFFAYMKDAVYEGSKVVLMLDSREKAEHMVESLKEMGVGASYSEDLNREVLSGQVVVTGHTLPKGFVYPKIKYILFTHHELYGEERKTTVTKRKRKRKRSARDIINYSDLVEGDFVVHDNHGVGQYKGIDQIEVSGIKKDYLVIAYRGNDKLYIPTDQMNMIQKFVGGEARAPKISKLGGTDWIKAKSKAKKAVEEIAEDLVLLYAKRAKEKGYAFSADTMWQREFEDAFIYEETYAQLRSIAEIKEDMESEKPMDRLLCGDVGYGKTEVAIRAAFKAVMDGKQVAFLVPTTILAQQHYNTIKDRLGNFPVKVEMISRFRTAAQQRHILKDVHKGFVDVLVGTHRLLSKDLKFKDLGLLIVDEEQRFGVRHKERLKELRENLDVLTLSATPIPRTLQMGLVGIRDMSVLDEPPEERSPISTFVMEFDATILREAIIRELSRGGQVYFVYNRVQDMERMAERLSQLVPEARIITGHGQMPETQLEDVMIAFNAGEYDLLLCTTIIETGMDIQNVNTMIVYDADKMGLSQLYQLKGRIGRSDRSSFAYFTYQKDKVLQEVAEKRLMAIRDFTEFGSGFKIAMRDLELRGAGNLLGESQHGHIDAVGYDMYVKLLEEAIAEAKGEVRTVEAEIAIDIKVDGYIPNDYISDPSQKIEMYKRIAAMSGVDDYDQVIEELIDRYGDIPKPVLNICDISIIKYMAQKSGFSGIREKNGAIVFDYETAGMFSMKEIQQISEDFDGDFAVDLSSQPNFTLRIGDDKIREARKLIYIIYTIVYNR